MTQHSHPEPIAVVGSACRFPGGSSSPSKLWDLLRQPRDILAEFPKDRLNLDRFYHPRGETHGSTDVKNRSYQLSEDSRLFDAEFFGISPAEAEGMDPQQRVLLETVFEAFESAGCTLEKMRGSLTSVHVGVMNADYSDIQVRDTETLLQYNATGTARSIISNRVSYVFDLKGPSVTIDTACSSSLVALHYAVYGLRNGDCDTAVVAGANLIFDPTMYITESKLHMLSPDSQSRMWDKSADGYARGEGVAALILKPLSKALRDGDDIEGIIRETGVNSDGRSQGITMPHAPAQAELIRSTYRRAGLDPIKDRCQYFECHGTGTPAGDPVEARAIAEAFFDENPSGSAENPLFVGSIKTVLGHTEGSAGLAGVMKALLAIKHQTIPPNLHFNELNPAITPYYGALRIATAPVPWPELPPGTPARASVNSFGFGGTNAHAIIESHVQEPCDMDTAPVETVEDGLIGPLLLSARSGPSLLQNIRALLEHITEQPLLNLNDLGWLFQTRRTAHNVRTSFSATSREGLLNAMNVFVQKHQKVSTGDIGTTPRLINPSEIPGVLGVFTGQGAHWPTMGRDLIRSCPLFRKTIERCEAMLKALPDGPEWSLMQELTADDSESAVRLSRAALSQPLCTAVQLGLVDVLTAAGIRLDAVVGHSSGEIAATYAAGIITLPGAMQIAYYRGFHAKLARGAENQQGGMLAVGISFAEATEYCARPEFVGRLGVAASNSPQSVTLSGDLDAVNEAKQHFDTQNTFARLMKVDTAYHSHHMLPCAEPYLASLLACDIAITPPRDIDNCVWNSSVRGDTELLSGDLSALKGPYWVSNMCSPVLFSQALESSLWHGGPFDLVLEIGPHPALRGPADQTFKAALGSAISTPYTGVLQRGGNDVEALSAALGTVWTHLGPSFVDFDGFREAFFDGTTPAPRVVKDLPAYAWSHDKIYWRESRISRRYRTGTDAPHQLLGRRTPDDDGERELRWRNVLKLSEVPWLRGHEVLENVLLPAAAYVAIAIEAARVLAADQPVRLFEVMDVEFQRPVVIPDNKDGVETLFTVRAEPASAGEGEDEEVIKAQFAYYVCPDERAGSMVQMCAGRLVVHLGKPSIGALPERETCAVQQNTNLLGLDVDRVYASLGDVGLNYQGLFRGISEAWRSMDYANASGVWAGADLGQDEDYAIHPALLDVAFQTLFCARAHPSSGQITSALLPVHIKRVTLNPCVSIQEDGRAALDMESFVTDKTITSLAGDIHIYNTGSSNMAVQVESLVLQAVSPPDASQDRHMFAATVWNTDAALGNIVQSERDVANDETVMNLAVAIDRAALFYMKRLLEEYPPSGRQEADLQWHHDCMLNAFEVLVENVRNDRHPLLRKEWLSDEHSIVEDLCSKYDGQIDLLLTRAVGENLSAVVRGETPILEVLLKDDMLNRFYMEGCGFDVMNGSVREVVKQITFKFPRCNILEIGAGTGGTTWNVLNAIGDAYESYTYTDISTGFFEKAADKFSDFTHKMIFKPLDIEREVAPQGFTEESYDIIVAAYVLHATRNLQKTMEHARSLLKPGGFLVLLEVTAPDILRLNFLMGGLPGWWLGLHDGRGQYPGVSVLDWDTLLLNTGFSGVDSVMHDLADESKHCNSLIVTQSVDDTMLQLRDPLLPDSTHTLPMDSLLVLGGRTLTTSKMLNELRKSLPTAWKRSLETATGVDAVDTSAVRLTPGMDVICFQELDSPLFATPMTKTRMAKLQSLLINARNMLWVISDSPRTNLFLGIARALFHELPHLNLQVIRLEPGQGGPTAMIRTVMEAFVRLKIGSVHKEEIERSLWFQEPELVVAANGQRLIPRVMPNAPANELYNASRRVITKLVDATDVAVEVGTAEKGKLMLTAAFVPNVDAEQDGHFVIVKTRFTLHIPGQGREGFHLCFGHTGDTESAVIVLSKSNASVVRVLESDVLPISERDCTPAVLLAMVNHLLARSIAELGYEQGTKPGLVLVYEADEALAVMVSSELARRPDGVGACFVTSKPEAPEGWIKVHPRDSARTIRRLIPRTARLFIDCSSLRGVAPNNVLQECLPSDCQIRKLEARTLQDFAASATAPAKDLLEQSYMLAIAHLDFVSGDDAEMPYHLSCPIVKASELPGADVSQQRQMYITSWEDKASLSLTVRPPDLSTCLNPFKTYLMIGMAGGLGLSICQWMIRNGAKHLVITSRKPAIDPAWLEDARREGVNLRILPMDVSDRSSVEATIGLIRAEMPPIGGVCNAAMVLSDRLFVNMDVDQLNNTLAPKVDGTDHLNATLADTPLDFFILLSSSASIFGNPGQSNYHAANLFMAGLASQRRQRGLVASVIHIGLVIDVGYVTRQQDRDVEGHLRSQFFLPVSETDVHHAFAEAIAAGKPDSDRPYELIMGIEPFTQPIDPDRRPGWLSNPRFSHFLPPIATQQAQRRNNSSNGTSTNVRQQVEEADSEAAALDAVNKAFAAKLESMLQLAAGSVDGSRALIDLGIDSLVAVEIRTWFLKELDADVSIMKILGGDTVAQIATGAAKRVLADLDLERGERGDALKEDVVRKDVVVRDVVKVERGLELKVAPDLDGASSELSAPPPVPDLDISSEPYGIGNAARAADADSDSAHSSSDGSTNGDGDSSINTNDLSDISYISSEGVKAGLESSPEPEDPPIPEVKKHNMVFTPEPVEDEVSEKTCSFVAVGEMTPAQCRLWFASRHVSDPTAYNMTFQYEVQGYLDTSRLRYALDMACQQHEALRTAFYTQPGDGQPMQGILAVPTYTFKHVSQREASTENDIDKEVAFFQQHNWDLGHGCTFGVTVISLEPKKHILIFGYHHIIMDATSWAVFLRDLNRSYQGQNLGQRPPTCIEFSQQHIHLVNSTAFQSHIQFWKEEFASLPETPPLLPVASVPTRPTEPPPNNFTSYACREVDAATTAQLRKTCQSLRITPFHCHLAVLQVLLSRYLSLPDICIGVADANRTSSPFASTLGFFMNILPLRTAIPNLHTTPFRLLAQTTSQKFLSALSHSAIPLDTILDAVHAPRAANHTPLFQIAVNYRQGAVMDVPLGESTMTLCRAEDARNPYDISLCVIETGAACVVEMTCHAALYDSGACEVLLGAYLRLLRGVAADPERMVGSYEMHDSVRVRESISLGTGPEVDFGWGEGTLSGRVMEMCTLFDEGVAITDREGTIKYKQLQARVFAGAEALVQAGVGEGSVVAVLCEPSGDFVVAMLAVMCIGGVYMPLDISLPAARHIAMVEDAKPSHVVFHAATEELAKGLVGGGRGFPLAMVRLEREIGAGTVPAAVVPCTARNDTPAVLLYTSGSTGKPKGILLSQANLANHVAAKTAALKLGRERVLQQSSLGFDMSLIQIFSALANGGTLAIVPAEWRRDPAQLTALAAREHVSLTIATPSEYAAWLAYGVPELRGSKDWRHACLGGEVVTDTLLQAFHRLALPDLRLTNCYGPTEITAAATFQTLEVSDNVSQGNKVDVIRGSGSVVGRALPNYSVYITSPSGDPLPVLHTGEICIGGLGVAHGGYLNLTEETAARFVPDAVDKTRTMYRTGDMGRLAADGSLVFLSRMDGDTQVKLRGLRIELTEVEEAVLTAAKGVLGAVVVSLREEVLVAHAVLVSGRDMEVEDVDIELEEVLSRLPLPQYMVPARIVVVQALPTTSNGKIDRKAVAELPLPARGAVVLAHPEKLTLAEGELRLLWEKVLRTDTSGRITPTSDFFLCGGNSLLLMRLQAAIKEAMGVAVSTRDLYQASTLRQMAAEIGLRRDGQPEDDEIKWDVETAVPDWVLQDASVDGYHTRNNKPPKHKTIGIEVLLTGATSFLGSVILHSLTTNTSISKIHCVAISPDEAHLIPSDDDNKITTYTGTLLSPTLGLTPSETSTLPTTIDVIIHAGANGHCLNKYSSLRVPNVHSTRFLASLAVPNQIPLLLLSTSRVALLSGTTTPLPASVAKYRPPTDGSDGYTASKWASEVFLERLTQVMGRELPRVQIHRPCVVVGAQAPSSDALNAILRFSRVMRKTPAFHVAVGGVRNGVGDEGEGEGGGKKGEVKAEGYFDFQEVEVVGADVAAAAVALATGTARGGSDKGKSTGLSFHHHSSGVKTPVSGFRQRMEERYGGVFEEVPMDEWIAAAIETGIDPLITAYLEGLIERGQAVVFPYLGETVALT